MGDRADPRRRGHRRRRLRRAHPVTLEAYCHPASVAAGDPIRLHLSSSSPVVAVEVDARRSRATDRVAGRGDRRRGPRAAARRERERLRLARRARDPDGRRGTPGSTRSPSRTRDERAEAFAVVRPDPSNPADILLVLSTATYAAYNDWGGPSLYTGGTRVSFERPLARGFLRKPDDSPRKAQGVPDREALAYFRWAEPLGYSPWSGGSGWWNWERPFVAWAEREGFRDRRRDLRGPRASPRGPRRRASVPLGRPRRVLVVGHARHRRGVPRARRQRRVLQRQHLLLAGPPGGRLPRDDVLQVPRGRRPRPRERRPVTTVRRLVRPPRRPSRERDDRAVVHPRWVLALRARRPEAERRVHGLAPGALGVRGHRPALRRRARSRRRDRRVRGRRVRTRARGRTAGPDPRRRRTGNARGPRERTGEALATRRATEPLRARAGRARARRDEPVRGRVARRGPPDRAQPRGRRRVRARRRRDGLQRRVHRLGVRARRRRTWRGSRATCSNGSRRADPADLSRRA